VPLKNLKKAYLRVSVQTSEQLLAVLAVPKVGLVYLDAGLFSAEDWKHLTDLCHKGSGGFGKLAGLRLPQIWRKRVERFLEANAEKLFHSGFDVFLAGNPEEILWLREHGVPEENIICDFSIYSFNRISDQAFAEMIGTEIRSVTWSQELNYREMLSMKKNCPERDRELIVYGRTPLMVTAQCIRKTSIGCDRRMSLMWMKDRTAALMPVRNCCTFCMNTIYNAVPTVLFDMETELSALSPAAVRYEFTCENKEQVGRLLDGNCPEDFTRGHFKRGVL